MLTLWDNRFLISRGADPEAKAHSGTTPVYGAARNGSVEAVETLLLVGIPWPWCLSYQPPHGLLYILLHESPGV